MMWGDGPVSFEPAETLFIETELETCAVPGASSVYCDCPEEIEDAVLELSIRGLDMSGPLLLGKVHGFFIGSSAGRSCRKTENRSALLLLLQHRSPPACVPSVTPARTQRQRLTCRCCPGGRTCCSTFPEATAWAGQPSHFATAAKDAWRAANLHTDQHDDSSASHVLIWTGTSIGRATTINQPFLRQELVPWFFI
jgi:hypothetical protein